MRLYLIVSLPINSPAFLDELQRPPLSHPPPATRRHADCGHPGEPTGPTRVTNQPCGHRPTDATDSVAQAEALSALCCAALRCDVKCAALLHVEQPAWMRHSTKAGWLGVPRAAAQTKLAGYRGAACMRGCIGMECAQRTPIASEQHGGSRPEGRGRPTDYLARACMREDCSEVAFSRYEP